MARSLATQRAVTHIALGFAAGSGLTTGSQNIDIGKARVAGESGTIRIGDITSKGLSSLALAEWQ